MTNLLTETIEVLKENGKEPKDVLWVGDNTLWFSWDYFVSISNKEYDSGYGGEEVLLKLLVVGDSWWLERHEYDGSEWWEFKSLPTRPIKEHKMPSIFYRDYYDTEKYNYVWREDTFQTILDKKITEPSSDKRSK